MMGEPARQAGGLAGLSRAGSLVF